jgi:hypothetical protein
MIVMLDTPQSLDECAKEIGASVEQFFSPQTYRRAQQPEQHFAIDNGAFGNFDAALFLRLVERERQRRDLCRFVAVPDVVGDARRTLEVFSFWRRKSELAGWPLALVVQNGQEHLPIPWAYLDAIFVGGDTAFKEGDGAKGCIKAAQALGKWVHVGRVNTPGRFEHFEKMGVDSIDGTGLARYSHMRAAIHENATAPRLAFDEPKTNDHD